MNCEICFNPYDHSIHKPYVLSCPHTFCKFCVDLLTTNKCPTCNTDISIKNPNIALLNLIPESSYDKLKVTFHKTLIELTNIINTVNIKGEPKLCKYLEKILATRNIIKTETNKFIELVRSSELELLNQLIEIEKNVKDRLLLQTDWQQQIETEIKTNKLIVEKNMLTNEELNDLVDDSNEIKRQLNEIQSEIEEFNDQIEFTLYEYVSFKDGLIGEIKTDKVTLFVFFKKLNFLNKYFC